MPAFQAWDAAPGIDSGVTRRPPSARRTAPRHRVDPPELSGIFSETLRQGPRPCWMPLGSCVPLGRAQGLKPGAEAPGAR